MERMRARIDKTKSTPQSSPPQIVKTQNDSAGPCTPCTTSTSPASSKKRKIEQTSCEEAKDSAYDKGKSAAADVESAGLKDTEGSDASRGASRACVCDDSFKGKKPQESEAHHHSSAKNSSLNQAASQNASPKRKKKRSQKEPTAVEQRMLRDIETMEKLLQETGTKMTRRLEPLPLVTAIPSMPREGLIRDTLGPPRLPPLWSSDAKNISAVTALCPPTSSRGVGIKLSRGKIARGVLLSSLKAALACDLHDGKQPTVKFAIPLPSLVPRTAKQRGKEGVTLHLNEQRGESGVKANNQVPAEANCEASSSNDKPVSESAGPALDTAGEVPSVGWLKRHPGCMGLYAAWKYDTPLHLFLEGCAIEDATASCKKGADALALLRCNLPNGCGAVSVGWARCAAVELSRDDEGRRSAYFTLEMEPRQKPWWLETTTATSAPLQQLCTSDLAFASRRSRDFLRATACDQCHRVIHRTHWTHWHCEACNLEIPAIVPTVEKDVDFGRTPMPTEGPRMDNGRALFVLPVTRELRCWSDGLKSAHYLIPRGGGGSGESAQQVKMTHLLSHGYWKRQCDATIERILAPSMPYRRLPSDSNELPSTFSLAMALNDGGDAPPPYLAAPIIDPLEDLDVSESLLGLAEDVERRIGRLPDMHSFSMLTVVVGQVNKSLPLLKSDRESSVETAAQHRQVTYLHLGAPHLLSVSKREANAKGKKTLLNAMVAHGDVLTLKYDVYKTDDHAIGTEEGDASLSIAVQGSGLCIGIFAI